MDPDSNITVYILLLFVLILINAFFAMSEIAIITLNDSKVRKQAAAGSRKAKLLVGMLDKPSDFLATIQVGVTLSGFMASAVAADTFTEHLVAAVRNAGWAVNLVAVRVVALIGITFILSYFTLVLGELVPKRLAMKYYEKIAFAVAPALNLIYKLEKPFVKLLSVSTNGMLRLFGIDPNQQSEEVTEEEIRMMIDVGEESGHIEQSDKDMINNIFEFDDRTVEEMMTHRTEVTAIEVGTSLEETVRIVKESGHSRIPVYKDDLDTIVGILYVKDLLSFIGANADGDFDITRYMRTALYVPESTNGKTLLREFKETKIQLAVVVDEYGGTSGIVTMEDLIESIVGNIQDEYDDEEEEISVIADNRYIIDGLTPMDSVMKFFDLEIAEEDDFDTIGGYVVNRLGYIPDEEEYPTVSVGEVVFTVRSMDERRIAKLEAERIPKEQETSA
ncbi:hemolysin family protein [Ruminococcaceae bacterium OttesenSCG-928-L11]|nr:hemolysin family protein [Ruminococcaceae bacterium OttesenSCG-928-L11]